MLEKKIFFLFNVKVQFVVLEMLKKNLLHCKLKCWNGHGLYLQKKKINMGGCLWFNTFAAILTSFPYSQIVKYLNNIIIKKKNTNIKNDLCGNVLIITV